MSSLVCPGCGYVLDPTATTAVDHHAGEFDEGDPFDGEVLWQTIEFVPQPDGRFVAWRTARVREHSGVRIDGSLGETEIMTNVHECSNRGDDGGPTGDRSPLIPSPPPPTTNAEVDPTSD